MFYLAKPEEKTESVSVMGLSFLGGSMPARDCTRVSWHPDMAQAFAALAAAAKNTGDPAGNRLPYATLRALLSAGLPDPIYVDSDLGGIGWHDSEKGPRAFAECAATEDECLKTVTSAVRMWTAKVLAPWAEARGLPADFAEEITRLAIEGSAATASRKTLETEDGKGKNFTDVRDIIHAEAFRRIAGTELFPGMGPVRTLIRSSFRDNSICFVTFPRAAASGSWSMQARLTVETLPGQTQPFVRIDVSRKRWTPDVPGKFLPRQRKLTATVFGEDERRAVSFHVPILKGAVSEPEDPAYVLSALKSGVDTALGFAQLVKSGPQDGAFVGIAYSTAYETTPSVATGATELDCIDCFDRIVEAMKGVLERLAAEPVERKKRVKRSDEDIPAMKSAMVLEEIARSLGYNDIDDKAIAETWNMLSDGDLPPSVKVPADVEGQRERFDLLREDNSTRLRQVFGTSPPVLVIVSASIADAEHIGMAVRTLFNSRLRIEYRLMPEGVHGPRKSLSLPNGKARDRYENRVSLWKPFAQKLAEEFGATRVLVHARRFADDGVNKIAGRVALARYGDCNVQYLDSKGPKVDDWFFRIQAAVLDLMFGHSALISPVRDNVSEAFPNPATRPETITGISVVSLNRTRTRQASSFFLSVSIDIETGSTTARAGRPINGSIDITDPLPFFDLLKTVASWDEADTGNGETEKSDFQTFVAEIASHECDRGRKPLIMFEGDHARQLWPALSNKGWDEPRKLVGTDFNPSEWPGARIVRVQDQIEPAVITRKEQTFAILDPETGEETGTKTRQAPTLTDSGRLVRLAGAADNYISTGHLDGTQKLPKGLSVYRPIPQMKTAAGDLPPALADMKIKVEGERDLTTEPYKLPGTVGILVVHHLEGDDPDRIAALCHGLRFGFGHTRSPVKMPAPLFHTKKVAEYIPAYVLSEEDEREEVSETVESPEQDEAEEPDGLTDAEDGNETDAGERQPASHAHLGDLPFMNGTTGPQGATAIPNSSFPKSGTVMLPAEIRARANGDQRIESILEKLWVGPLPSCFSEEWLMSLLSAHSSVKPRQKLYDVAMKVEVPFKLVLPETDVKDDRSFARFLITLLQLGDACFLVNSAIPRTIDKNRGRWIFNPVYEQIARKGKAASKLEPGPSLVDTLYDSPFNTLKKLHEGGDGLLARHFMAVESIFKLEKAAIYAETAGKLRQEFGIEYADTEAFCGRMAAFQEQLIDYLQDMKSILAEMEQKKASPRIGRLGMDDYQTIAEEGEPARPSVPDVNAAWLRDRISLSGAFRSHLHNHRAEIREALGNPKAWPEDKPSSEVIADCVAKLFSVPEPILAAISKRDRESLFKPFHRKIESTVRAIDESRPEEKRLTLANWEEEGIAPAIFTRLIESGYKQTADEFAKIRAIENPSLPLERAVKAAGEEFANTAGFIEARRKASLWFFANDDRSDSPLYEDYLDSFENGEVAAAGDGIRTSATGAGNPPEKQEEPEAREIEPQVVVHEAGQTRGADMSIEDIFRAIMREAEYGVEKLGKPDWASLSASLDNISGLLDQAQAAVASLPRQMSNAALVARARELEKEAAEICEFLGFEHATSGMPEEGEIDPSSAEKAGRHLDEGGAALVGTKLAVDAYRELDAKIAAAKPAEKIQLSPSMYEKVGEAESGIGAVASALVAAVALLAPASPSPDGGDGPDSDVSDETRQPESIAREAEIETRASTPDPVVVATGAESEYAQDGAGDIFEEVIPDEDILEPKAAEDDVVPMAAPLAQDGDAVATVPEQKLETPPAEDLETLRINQALDRFMESGSYSLAFHLARASEAEDLSRPLFYTAKEAKLAAIAGHLNHNALQSNLDLVSSWVNEALGCVELIERDANGERAAARLLTLMPLATELAIFSPSYGSAEILRSISSLPGDLGKNAGEVFKNLDSLKHTTIVLSRAMLANVADEMDLTKALNESRAHLFQKIEGFQGLRFNYQPGNKIKNELSRSDNLIGKLRTQITKGKDDDATLAVVKDFAEALKDRNAVIDLLDETHAMHQDRSKGLDGVVRNRLVSFLENFRDAANTYIDLKSEMRETSSAERPKARDLAKRISRSLNTMTAAVEAAARDAGLIGTAARHVALRLKKLSAIVSGEQVPSADSNEYLQACHAEIALIPELDYGRSWLPSPYVAARLVDLLCGTRLPLLPERKPDRDEVFDNIVRQRMERGSFVGARMLLDAADFFDIDQELAENLGKEVDEAIFAAKETMREDIGQARKVVERVMRFGSLRQGTDAETAASLLDRLEKIEAVDVPVTLEPGARVLEEIDGIFDVSVAQDEIETIREGAQALLEEPRIRLQKDIDELSSRGIDPQICQKLRALCETDDLLTAEEHIQEVRNERRLPESRRRNWRFETFRDKVLPALEHYRGDIASNVSIAIMNGDAFEGIAYDQLSETRRKESVEIVTEWRDLFRKFHVKDFSPFAASFLEKFGISAEFKDVANILVPPSAKGKMYVGDFKLDIPTDTESLLLPDFGSRTEGNYRVAVSQSLPPESTLQKLPAGNGLILLVSDIVTPEERRKFLTRNLAANRRILLIDSATISYAVSEPQIRALTLVELAQPYSFAEPYADWGRSAVPREMFVGREQDIRAILLDSGSNIVYGGRRMGKTALLKHIELENNDPKRGRFVGFVDAHQIGKGHLATKVIWQEIARALPDIFQVNAPIDATRVTQTIKRWLEDDNRRRIYLLLDECDQFIVSDAARGYTEFLALQQLMTDTNRRFKFVLAGLSNVTRLVQTGNPPLKQISADPRRIGSLTGEERTSAEDLVLRPFAALGLELERQDIWRILSHSNYYPVLIQTYAKHLLKKVLYAAHSTQMPVRKVPSELIASVLDDQATKSEIKGIFDMTLEIDLRYKLIAYVVASLVFEAEAEGRMDDGFTTREIRETSISFWEAGFKDKNRFSLFDDLLDEMEGLGIVRRVGTDRWTLRSTAVVRLLGTRDEIDTVLLEFTEKEAPIGFDPKSHRREIKAAKHVLQKRTVSPLTLSQERDTLLSGSRATIILGNKLADYDIVPAVLKTVPDSFSDGDNYDVRILSVNTSAEMASTLRDQRVVQGKKAIAVIKPSAPWTAEWVKSAINAKPVTKGDVRVIFVGGPQQAASVASDGQLAGLTSHVEIIVLEPWSTAFFTEMADKEHPGPTILHYDDLLAQYGGWNEPMSQYVGYAQRAKPRQMPDAVGAEETGLAGEYGKVLAKALEMNGPTPFSVSDADAFLELNADLKVHGMTGEALIQYGTLMGLLAVAPAKPGVERQKSSYLPTLLTAGLLDMKLVAAE
ncbi:RNaseH domain-containing protein [Mesorhizobium kowhaii]|uniref:RNaseH domain-containing protein n=1 Tax=Mesorhizobium kowhaii TaxID=1300272 RepID=UPI0035E8F1D2